MDANDDDHGTPIAAAGTVRDAVVGDAAAIEFVHFASREAAYRDHVSQWPPPGPDREGRVARWARWLADPGIHCIVSEHDGEILGFCTVRAATDDDVDPASVAEMPTLYVHPDHWRSGLGRVLCQVGIERAAGLGYAELVLWVLQLNERARAFYDSMGFRPDGTTKVDDGTPDRFVADRLRIALEPRAG